MSFVTCKPKMTGETLFMKVAGCLLTLCSQHAFLAFTHFQTNLFSLHRFKSMILGSISGFTIGLFLTNISIHFYLLGWVVANIHGTWTNIWQKSNVNKCVNFPHGQIFYQAVTKQQIRSRATMAKYWKPNWKVWGK